jgi:hypothetical protein
MNWSSAGAPLEAGTSDTGTAASAAQKGRSARLLGYEAPGLRGFAERALGGEHGNNGTGASRHGGRRAGQVARTAVVASQGKAVVGRRRRGVVVPIMLRMMVPMMAVVVMVATTRVAHCERRVRLAAERHGDRSHPLQGQPQQHAERNHALPENHGQQYIEDKSYCNATGACAFILMEDQGVGPNAGHIRRTQIARGA